MAEADDIDYLRNEMSPAVFGRVMQEWANQLRELRREEETELGTGNGEVEIRQEVKAGHPAKTWIRPAVKCFEKRNGGERH